MFVWIDYIIMLFAHMHSVFGLNFLVFNIETFQFSVFKHFSFQYSNILVFTIHTFQFSNFQIPSKHFTKRFQISIFNIHTPKFRHFNFQIPNASHRNFNFQLQVFTHPNLEILFLKFSNSKQFHIQISNFNFQLLIFIDWNSNILFFKFLNSKHSIYWSTLASLAHASQTIN
jgi:hypothetical protein